MELFYRDAVVSSEVFWEDLIDELNQCNSYNPYCKSDDYYLIFKQIILSLLLGESIVLLDSDFTKEELEKLTGYSDFESFTHQISEKKFKNIVSKNQLLSSIHANKSNWKITLFTSGTTGLPKRVTHSFESISRFVKLSNLKNIWGFAYNPTHIAGLQVFFQAFLNGNPIIRLFGLQQSEILHEIQTYNITHLSATPTFFRLLLPIQGIFPSLSRITSGGEKFDSKTIEQLKIVFSQAKITNVYASTEAGSLFAADGDIFTIKPEIQELVRIENNELFIHHSLMGVSEMNTGEWYATGDIIDIIEDNPIKFRFLSRKNEMINVGGYKVNPHEVEEVIRSIPGIMDVRIFSKSNSVLGNIICCEVVKNNPEIEETSIRLFLQSRLQEFKIPRMIKFVDSLTTTRTGKIKR
ncbi:MAG: class I adenylate-forming enzyme family protein [Bacteroidales bacterium]